MCMGEDVWCNYCKRCEFMYRIWATGRREKGKVDDKVTWMRMNRMWAMKAEKRRADTEKSLRLLATGDIPHWFFTVTFDASNVSPEDAQERMIECTKGYDLGGGIAGLEYFSERSPDGGHLHFHLLSPKTKKYKPSVLIKRIAKICKVKDNFVDLGCSTGTFTKRVEYICGLKKDEKVDYCAKDREWRDLLGFTQIYLGFTDELRERYKYALDNLRC